MTLKTDIDLPPVGLEDSNRLGTSCENPDFKAEMWNAAHNEFQARLDPLVVEIRQRIPGIRVDSGRTHGEHFLLFSYRTFSVPDKDTDPVVAGLTLNSTVHGATVEADVSGEQTGDSIWSKYPMALVNSSQELLAAAQASAQNLCLSADTIVAALMDSSRQVE